MTSKERLTKEEIIQATNSQLIIERTAGKQMATKMVAELLEYKEVEELYHKLVEQKRYFTKSNDGTTIYEEKIDGYVLYDIKERELVPMYYEPEDYLPIDSYGKTWALTREELENDK